MTMDYGHWLSWLFPRSTDEQRLVQVTSDDMVSKCSVTQHRHFIALSQYQDPIIRAAIHTCKFHHNRRSARLLGALLEAGITKLQLADAVFIPVPLSAKRQRERGYNQVSLILENTSLPYHESLLTRTRHTPSQTALTRAKRRSNVEGAFALSNESAAQKLVTGKTVVVLDDVVTTGATLAAAAAALRPLPYTTLICLALAH